MFDSDFKQKIKSADELSEILGSPPRSKTVIMCHGAFDIVHPGHVRHLVYAKSKADILVASLTCDAFVQKANYRPFVPEDLRALNLAALQMIDYVVIDRNAKPLENINKIKPDFFAKGYEYIDGGLDPRSAEEKGVLDSYGGQFIFTPGDIVFSSSSIIEDNPPDLTIERLMNLMNAESLGFDDLRASLADIKGATVHVLGDTIVDSYVQTTLIGGNTKTPTFSVRYEMQSDYVGGAGVVAKHLSAAGAHVVFTTVLGNDEWSEFVIGDLQAAGVKVNALIDDTRPTTNKKYIIAGGYRLLKIDTLDNRSISDNVVEQIISHIRDAKSDITVFSDFRHGIFSPATIPDLIAGIPEGTFRVADSQVASRWGNILDFQSFDLITPNEREARFALGDQDSVVRPLGLHLYQQAKCGTLILKLGERGIITYRGEPKNESDLRSFFVVDSFAENVVDAVGSGDALLAYSTLSLACTKDPVQASILGSLAAACACQYDGNIAVEPDNILSKIAALEEKAVLD